MIKTLIIRFNCSLLLRFMLLSRCKSWPKIGLKNVAREKAIHTYDHLLTTALYTIETMSC